MDELAKICFGAKEVVQVFLDTAYSHGVNHERRLGQLRDYEAAAERGLDSGQ